MLADYLLNKRKKNNGLSESTHDLYNPSMIPIQVAICLLVPHFPNPWHHLFFYQIKIARDLKLGSVGRRCVEAKKAESPLLSLQDLLKKGKAF